MGFSRSCKIGTAGIICGVFGIALFTGGVVLFVLPPPVETIRCGKMQCLEQLHIYKLNVNGDNTCCN